VKSGNLNDGLVLETDETITEAGLAASSAKVFPKGTLLIAMYGATVGKLGILDLDAATNQAICAIRPNSKVDRDFLFFFLLNKRRQLLASSIGGAQPNISQNIIRDLEIPIPSKSEQHRVVGLLVRASEIRRRADAARAKARAIIPALFNDTFGDPATNPKGWPVVTVGDLQGSELRNGISPSKMGKVVGNVLTLSAITRGSFDPGAKKESMFAAPLAEEQTVSRSLFLICRGNGNRHLVGQGAFPHSDMPGVAFPDTMIALRIDESELAPAYLAAVWSSDHLRAQIDAAAKTTNGTFKISQGAIVKFSFPLPPRQLQTAFAERVSHLERLARNLDAAAAKTEEISAALSSEVFDQPRIGNGHD
jgi:type I restriction enzyme S subunit